MKLFFIKMDNHVRGNNIRLLHTLLIIFPTLIFFLFRSFLLAEEVSGSEHLELWEKIRSGDHVVMIRHALAPGMGDPANFNIGQCETQRNLSQEGRDQARELGNLFRKNGIYSAKVYSSEWCRCLETARLLGLSESGEVAKLPILNSFFQNYEKEKPQTRALTQWLQKQKLTEVTILVTHQVNITAFTDIVPISGEMVVIHREKQRDGFAFTTVGSIKNND